MNMNCILKTLILLQLLIAVKVEADHGQWDCQANEVYIECGSCEATCKMPLIKDCSKSCRPQRCECQAKNGFVRAHDGACIHVSECETYTLMGQLRPGQHVAIIDQTSIQPTTNKPTKHHKKTTKSHGIHFDEPQTEVPATLNDQESEEENEREITNDNIETTHPVDNEYSQLSSSGSDEEDINDRSGLSPSIAPNNYGFSATSSKSNKKSQAPFTLNQDHHVLDRDSALVNYNQNPKANFLGSIPHLPSFRSTTLIGNDREDRSEDEGGYSIQNGLQAPTRTYGARPISPGEVSDRYVSKTPSVGAPARNPQPPGNPTYKFAYAPSSPVLMHDDSVYALYPPQKYRIYRRKRQEPIGPPRD